jgi:outer membrane protein insertion porin family
MLFKSNKFCLAVFSIGLFVCSRSFSVITDNNLNDKSRKIKHYLKQNQQKKIENNKYVIEKILISGNKNIKKEIILNSIPYEEGIFFDASKSDVAIHNLYSLGHFRQIQLEGEVVGNKKMHLHVVIEEKKLLGELKIEGNKKISYKKFDEKLQLSKFTNVDEEMLHQIAENIKKIYQEENRHFVKVSTELISDKENPNKVLAIITIAEGPKSQVARVFFKGNSHILDRKLRKHLFTREKWLLGFVDSAGSYNEEALEMDKHRIEYLYRDNGYLMAKVYKTDIKFSKDKKNISIMFYIKEGEQFIVDSIDVPGDEIFLKEELLPLVVLEKDQPFSQTNLVSSINKLRDLWGEKGYIYADVYPQVKPNETTNKVSVVFHIDRGKKLYTNRVFITGNTVTRDKVIRRQLDIIDGDLITTKKLQKSKASVEYLSFFERDGVNWKMHRISDTLADLEMNVQEAKTGHLNFNLTYGSDQNNPERSLKGMISIEKNNLCGLGWDIGGMIEANRHRIKKLETHFFDPHIFDTNIAGGINLYKRWEEYDQWTHTTPSPIQRVAGGNLEFALGLPKIDKHLKLHLELGYERIRNNDPVATGPNKELFEPIVRRTFQKGSLKWLGLDLIKDTRNHQVYPNKGYKLVLSTKTAPPGFNSKYGFFKVEAHGSCYTTLMGVDTLVIANQLKLSHITTFGKKIIPYKELFHMGGQSTVRGHLWGGIGPAWITGDPLGARNAAQFNTELIFPLIEDYSMKAHLFYDTGAGWHTPKENLIYTYDEKTKERIPLFRRNSFDLRHSVGFGINLTKPFPAKIDWGFKLDRKRDRGESPHEFHLSMNYAW